MNKLLATLALTMTMVLSLTSCGENNHASPSANIAENASSPLIGEMEENSSMAPPAEDKETNQSTMLVTMQQKGDNTVIVLESDLVTEFSHQAVSDTKAQFLVQFQDKAEKTGPTKGFSLSYDFEFTDEPFAFFHSFVSDEDYSIYDNEGTKISFYTSENQATWVLNEISLPLEGVELVTAVLLSGNNTDMYGYSEIPLSDVKTESTMNTSSKETPDSSSSAPEKAALDYIGTYYSTDSKGNKYKIVVDENTLTVNDRYVADFTNDDVIRTYWRGTITDTKTGEKEEEQDFQLQTLHEDGKDQMFLTLYAWFNEEEIIVEHAKRVNSN